MALVLSNATIMANDNGNVIIVNNLDAPFQNLADSLTFKLKDNTSNLTMPVNGRIVYQGLSTIECIVSAKYSSAYFNGGNAMGICLHKNGLQIEGSISQDVSSPEIINFKIEMSNDDYIEVWANSLQPLQPAELIQCQLSVFSNELT